jgi:hypothetical protein
LVSKRRIKTPKKRSKDELVKSKRDNLHKMNPGGHEVVRATIPTTISRVLTQFSQIVDHSHKHLRGGENLTRMKKMQNGGGEGDGGSLIIFNRAITQSPIFPCIQLSQTT